MAISLKDSDTSATLFRVFFENFSIESISEMGWYAAQDWMIYVTPALFGIAFIIRAMEEKAQMIAGKDVKYKEMVVTALLTALAIALYFTIASMIIKFSDAIYSTITTDSLGILGERLDAIIQEVWAKEYQFKFSELGDSLLTVGALMMYWTTHMVLVTVTFFLKVGHAAVLSFTIFWGSVALPISITRGIKMLKPLGTLTVFVLIWPIIEAYFTFVITSVFMVTLDHPLLDPAEVNRLTMGKIMFFYMSFAVIQLVLVAAVIAAPLLANSLAMGSGSAMGVVASFAGAGLAAGMQMANIQNKAIQGAGKKIKDDGDVKALSKAIGNSPLGRNLGEATASGVSSLAKGAMNKLKPSMESTSPEDEQKGSSDLKPGVKDSAVNSSQSNDSQSNQQKSNSRASNGPRINPKPASTAVTSLSSKPELGLPLDTTKPANIEHSPRPLSRASNDPRSNPKPVSTDVVSLAAGGSKSMPLDTTKPAEIERSPRSINRAANDPRNQVQQAPPQHGNNDMKADKSLSKAQNGGKSVASQIPEDKSPNSEKDAVESSVNSHKSNPSEGLSGTGSQPNLSNTMDQDGNLTASNISEPNNAHSESKRSNDSTLREGSKSGVQNEEVVKAPNSRASHSNGDLKMSSLTDSASSETTSTENTINEASLNQSVKADDPKDDNNFVQGKTETRQMDQNTKDNDAWLSGEDQLSSQQTDNKKPSSTLTSAAVGTMKSPEGANPIVNDSDSSQLATDNNSASTSPKKKPKKSREEMRRAFFMGKNRKK